MLGVYFLFGVCGVDRFIKYTEYTITDLCTVQVTYGGNSLPFLFSCRRCGAILYRDPKPVLRDGTYRRETYLESVVTKIGGRCPRCGRKLQVPPTTIEVSSDEARRVHKAYKGNIVVIHVNGLALGLKTDRENL
jgi:hypothetical protein